MTEVSTTKNSIELATQLTSAWLSNVNTRADATETAAFFARMREEIARLDGAPVVDAATAGRPDEIEKAEGAVSVKKSLASKDFIISMIDGRRYKMLRRHLATHGLTPEQYRERYGLKPDYPMVSETYSEQRRSMAKRIGLGTKAKRGKATK